MNRKLQAYPLWVIDPNFSIWSAQDRLNENDTVFWTGLKRSATGLIRYDGETYCFMGIKDNAIPLEQKEIVITAFETIYKFTCSKFDLTINFISPLLLNDLDRLSCPVSFTAYELIPKTEIPKDFSIAICLNENFCYNKTVVEVVGGVLPLNNFESAFMTCKRNLIMSNANDCIAPEWGDVYITGERCWYITESAIDKYIKEGTIEYIRKENEENSIFALNTSINGKFLIAYDDRVSIFYFGEWLKSYYFREGKTIIDALNESYLNFSKILKDCRIFDERLKKDCEKIGENYYLIACASLRQSAGAHKLVQTKDGELLYLSKECDSNGCIGTVDVTYPSMPLFLIYNPNLVNAMIAGIFKFARMPVWKYDFAPHDIGTYPWCIGQVYGVKNKDDKYSCNMTTFGGYPITHTMLYLRPKESDVYDFDMQMPVEECANMLIIVAAAVLAGGDSIYAKNNFDLLEQWVLYLEKFGLKPENQLCTDDFAGHLSNNVNLAIKALVGIESFSIICDIVGKKQYKIDYENKAKAYAQKLKALVGNEIMPLAYGQKDTYSLKYNLLFDKLFDFHLIGKKICEKETDYYITKLQKFGVPLDSRKTYTKSDWILWVSALTDNKEKRKKLYNSIVIYLTESPSRRPFGDWFDVLSGESIHMFNRTVQGGCFAPLLAEKGKLKRRKNL